MKLFDKTSVFQGIKFLVVGGGATVVDLAAFELFALVLGAIIPFGALVSKALSFLISTGIKFLGNKYWTFQKREHNNLGREIIQFSAITLVGLLIDVSCFFYCVHVLLVWTSISVVIAALSSAVWSFLGYKFFVFKK